MARLSPPNRKAEKAQPPKPKVAKAQPKKPNVMPAPAVNLAGLQRLQIAQIRQVQEQRLWLAQQAVEFKHLGGGMAQPANNNRIVLADGQPEVVPTCYAGAFRIRARTAPGPDKQSVSITLEVAAEPRHLGWDLVGKPRLELAGDDRGQALSLVLDPPAQPMAMGQWANARLAAQVELYYWHGNLPPPLKRTVQILIRRGARPSKRMEMKGQFTVESKTTNQALILVNDVLKARGKTIRGAWGGSIKVIDMARDKDGNHQIRFRLETPATTAAGMANLNQARVWDLASGQLKTGAPNSSEESKLALVDARGATFPVIGSSWINNNGTIIQTLIFKAESGRRPARLVFWGRRTVNVDVPFAFKEVKLP
jgi:hypothetical protein